MTYEQALKLLDSKFWENMSYEHRAVFQIFEKRLCMPFSIFHEAVEKTVGHPVYTHQFGSAGVETIRNEIVEFFVKKQLQAKIKCPCCGNTENFASFLTDTKCLVCDMVFCVKDNLEGEEK
jgi:hypothetical protein